MLGIKVTRVDWATHKEDLRAIREEVFIKEQGVPKELEWDDKDEHCIHLLARAGDDYIGCARLLTDHPDTAKIGRMAVLANFRSMGIGKVLIEQAEKVAKSESFTHIELSAQCQAFGFYSRLGYLAFSEPYNDADIPHIDMRKTLSLPSELAVLDMYQMGKDDSLHRGSTLLQSQGYLDVFLSQTERALIFSLKDLHHPLSRYEPMLDKIKQLAKSKRYFKAYILINNGIEYDDSHPLLELHKRLPSAVEVRQSNSTIPSHWVFDGFGWLDYDENGSRANYADRVRIRQFMEKFKSWWTHADLISEDKALQA